MKRSHLLALALSFFFQGMSLSATESPSTGALGADSLEQKLQKGSGVDSANVAQSATTADSFMETVASYAAYGAGQTAKAAKKVYEKAPSGKEMFRSGYLTGAAILTAGYGYMMIASETVGEFFNCRRCRKPVAAVKKED